jgi:hypothetical protein
MPLAEFDRPKAMSVSYDYSVSAICNPHTMLVVFVQTCILGTFVQHHTVALVISRKTGSKLLYCILLLSL